MPNGKGSGRRPAAVDDAKVASEWERIFPSRGRLFEFERSVEAAHQRAKAEGKPVYHEWPIAPEPHEQ